MLHQVTPRIPIGMLRHKVVLRQNSPAPVAFTAAALTQPNTLFGVPSKTLICGVMTRLVTTFSAFGMSSCLVTIGAKKDATTAANYYSPSFELIQAVSATSFKYWSPLAMWTTDAHDITATFTATGAQIGTLTAGEVEFTILYRPL